jgi:putative serine protease PepD
MESRGDQNWLLPGQAKRGRTQTRSWPPADPADATLRRRRRRSDLPKPGVVAIAALGGSILGSAVTMGGLALVRDEATRVQADASALTRANAGAAGADSTAGSAPAGEDVQAAAAVAMPSVVKVYSSGTQRSGSGSGVVLTADGQILTNYHVVEPGLNGALAVRLFDGTTAPASVIGVDPLTDLAALQVEGEVRVRPATLGDSDNLQVGQAVVALGAPFNLENTVTSGIVSALDRPVRVFAQSKSDPDTVFPAVQTDVAINPGRSNGTPDNSGGSIGLAFAFPISDALPIVEQLRRGEQPSHAVIGANIKDAQDRFGLPGGAKLGKLDRGGAAEAAGLGSGDVITSVDGKDVSSSDGLIARIRSYRPGDEIDLLVLADGSDQTSDVTLTLGTD